MNEKTKETLIMLPSFKCPQQLYILWCNNTLFYAEVAC